MEVHIVYRQRKKTGWFGRSTWGPKEVVTVYADATVAHETIKRWNENCSVARYTIESESVLYGWRLLKQELLDLLTEDGKVLLGLKE